MELAAAQELISAVGPIGAVVMISADITHMKKDIADIKADGKTTSTTLMQHMSQQHTRSR